MNLIFWHNIISPHQAPFMRELSAAGHQVLVVSAEEMSKDRQSLGWEVPSLGSASVVLNPSLQDVLEIVQSSEPDSIHFIAGARGTPLGRQAARACHALNRRVGIISEAPDTRGFCGFLRWVKYSFERFALGKSFNFVLAMGCKGVQWFKICGYPAHKIYPFIYVTERFIATRTEVRKNIYRFIFVGRFVEIKGLDVLLKGFFKVPDAELVLVGDGPDKMYLQNLAKKLGIYNRVSWLGQLNTAEVQEQLLMADVLVLPSRKDGWGAVINEALMAGTPVISSDACGAVDLIRYPWLGSVFRVNKIDSLVAAMLHWRRHGTISDQHRERVRNWSECIEAPQIAKYLEDVMNNVYNNGQRPKAPWYE